MNISITEAHDKVDTWRILISLGDREIMYGSTSSKELALELVIDFLKDGLSKKENG